MAQALPWLLGAQAAVNLVQTFMQPRPQVPPVLSWDEAMQRAQQTLNPLYDQQLQDTLRQVQLQNIRRGFFGQAPGAAISQDAASRLEAARAAAISQLAHQMVGQSAEQAAQMQALALNRLQGQQNAFGNLAAIASNLAQIWPTVFSVPNLGQVLQAGTQAQANMPGMPTTPAESRITPTFGNMGLANGLALGPAFRAPLGDPTRASFINPYR